MITSVLNYLYDFMVKRQGVSQQYLNRTYSKVTNLDRTQLTIKNADKKKKKKTI
jgi:hypothetical protein